MTTTTTRPSLATTSRTLEPETGAITGLLTGLTFVAAIVGGIRLAQGPPPRPGSPPAAIGEFYNNKASAVRFSAAGQAVSVLCLARFTGTVARLAARSTPGSRLLPATALVSGAASVAALTTSAATHAWLTLPHHRDDETTAKLARRMFYAGGPIHAVPYAVFTAVLATSARRTRLFGPGAATAGLASAATGILSPLYFRWENAAWLIPISRFSGYVTAGIAGIRLTSPRRSRLA
jgi:hypothetical protein